MKYHVIFLTLCFLAMFSASIDLYFDYQEENAKQAQAIVKYCHLPHALETFCYHKK